VQSNFNCPEHEITVAFELPSDAEALTRLWSQPIGIDCPVCGASHIMNYRDVYVTATMAEFQCLPADVQRARVH
jgi:hypothetical protein